MKHLLRIGLLLALWFIMIHSIQGDRIIPGRFIQHSQDWLYLPSSESLDTLTQQSRVVTFDLSRHAFRGNAVLAFEFIDVDPWLGYKLDMVNIKIIINGQLIEFITSSNSNSFTYREVNISSFFLNNQTILPVVFENNQQGRVYDGVMIRNMVLKNSEY
ncbi:MAG: hypothetical protein KBA26_13195 [Candidatus Delongbacteria bacterium]|nr:hypothetical protein [Candidatus Delongbacteria bacterium]